MERANIYCVVNLLQMDLLDFILILAACGCWWYWSSFLASGWNQPEYQPIENGVSSKMEKSKTTVNN